jgi:PAS domain S-box-containing protein
MSQPGWKKEEGEPASAPTSLRRQLVLWTVLVQCVLVLGYMGLSVWKDVSQLSERSEQRLRYQAEYLAIAASAPLAQHDMDGLVRLLKVESKSTTVRSAQITDLLGKSIVHTDSSMNGRDMLRDDEMAVLNAPVQTTQVLRLSGDMESVSPVEVNGKTVALAWVYPDSRADRQQITRVIKSSSLYGVLAIAANALVAILLAGTITRPVRQLVRGTRRVAQGTSPGEVFPLRVTSQNEIGELTEAFNAMVASLEKQRAGLNDTLALLDSMLANAPVGFAFLDRKFRFVRLNQYLADMNGQPVSRHLGREVQDVFPPSVAAEAAKMIDRVFETGESVRDLELSAVLLDRGQAKSWIANFFPVRASGERVRWVGVILSETTERKQTEEALRRSEKLAAAGRLAASIAHEINNPLEGVTNLLYLLRHHESLDAEARQYAEMAQHEVARVSEITQQTLRFYRQSTLPVTVGLCEVVDSVLVLHQGKVHAAQVEIRRRYRLPAEVLAMSGEIRQVLANLVGNALDAMPLGGNLHLRVTPSRDWKTGTPGIRLVCADTGSGMDKAVQQRIFEAFFTTKEATGTGLGLWVSAEILAKHNAVVRVRSRTAEKGKSSGTVFMVFFPEDGLQRVLVAKELEASASVEPVKA